jgi:hypothetical protein
MALPKIDVPIFDMILPSTSKSIKYRPFLVKEEKILLIAMQSGESSAIIEAVKQIISNCVIDDISVDDLSLFDIEYLFLNLRARSIGEKVDLRYRCNNIVNEEKCNFVSEYQVDLLTIRPKFTEGHTNKIQLTDKIGVLLTYPKFTTFSKASKLETNDETAFDIVLDAIEAVYDEEEVHYAKDTSKQEMKEFLDSLSTEHLKKLELFFETMPKIEERVHFNCPKCNHEDDIIVKGLESFFV